MSDIALTNSQIHQKQLRNLIKEQKNEIEKLKVNHLKTKNNIQNEQSKDIANIQMLGQEKRINRIRKHEEILEDLQKNLDKVKSTTDQELKNIQASHEKKKNDEKLLFEHKFNNIKSKNALQAEEATQIANGTLKRIKRNLQNEKSELERSSKSDISQQKTNSSAKSRLKAQEFQTLSTNESNKFNKALRDQKLSNNQILRTGETKYKDAIEKREDFHQKSLSHQEKSNAKRRTDKQQVFESRYQKSLTENESMLQKMIGKKDKVIHKLQKELKKEYGLALGRKDDNFYSMGKLKLNISELDDNKGYEIKIPINKDEANKIDFKAEKRELRFSMQRAHKFHTKEDGKFDSISKLETYTSKVPVEKIIDPKTIEKSYTDGVLKFKIGLA